MLCRRSLNRAGLALCLLAVLATACQRSQPAQVSSTPSRAATGAQSRDDAFWVTGWAYFLRPVKPSPPTDAAKGQEVWRGLFTGMANDAKTRELLTRLHGGWPAALFVIDAKDAASKSALKAPPPDGIAVAMRVADLNLKEVKTKAGSVPFREIACSRVIRIKDAVVADLPFGKEEPLPAEALDLAIEEYVLRTAPGWVARRGAGPETSFADDERLARNAEEADLPQSVEEQRRALDQRIKDYSTRAQAYYGAMRKQ